MKYSISAVALLSALPSALGFWRLECHGVAGIAQIDPIADPNVVGAHAHTIKGSNGLTINSTFQDLLNADCSSCQIKQDKSAYWEPQLYFMNANGSVHLVNEVPGHLTYYKYTPVYNSNGTLMMPEALPNGLRIISGDKMRRNFTLPVPDPPRPWSGQDATQEALAQKAIGFNCLNYARPGEDSLYRHTLPSKDFMENECPDGIRMEVLFPQCWNGQLDSDDHQSHVAFPDQGIDGGHCPEGFDHNTMQIFYETIYPTQNFKGVDGYYAFSNGDPTGCGYHGDLMVAWEEGVLQKALDQCGSDVTGLDTIGVTALCPVFDLIDPLTQARCLIDAKNEPADLSKAAVLNALPGNNPMQFGPQRATKPAADSSAPATPSYQPPSSMALPTLSYSEGSANVLADPATASPTGTSSSSTPTTFVQAVVTPAPSSADVAAALPALTTVVHTENGVVYEEVVVVDEVTVTDIDYVTVVAGQRKRGQHLARHNHARFHQH